VRWGTRQPPMPTSSPHARDERPLRPDDAPHLIALSSEAGWNQTVADWAFLIDHGAGWGLWEGETPIASAMILPYGDRFAWVNMVLVTASRRGQGIGTRLLHRCLDAIAARGAAAVLDATPAGRNIYLPLGFRDQWGLTRLEADRPAPPAPPRPVAVRPMEPGDLAAVTAFDRAMFGADRLAMIAHLAERCPDCRFVAEEAGRVTGFVLARDGRLALQLGPVAADDESTAIALAARALTGAEGRVFLDAADRHSGFNAWLARAGFTGQRPFTRMATGDTAGWGDPTRLFAAAGPELG